jgi:hypothetical protein
VWRRSKTGTDHARTGTIASTADSRRIGLVNASSSLAAPRGPRSASSEAFRRSTAFLALALLAACGRVAAEEPVTAVWKERELFFSYRSAVSIYSCDALRTRVASILYAVGARPDLQVKVSGCSQSNLTPEVAPIDRGRGTWNPASGSIYVPLADRQQVANVQVRLSMPVEMTPDVVSEMKSDKSRRELISRVTGDPIARFNDPIPFAAQRRVVTLSHKTVGLEPAECELLDQLVTSAFRKLELRVVRRGYSCDRNRISHIPPMVEVEALVAGSPEPREDPSGPAEGESESDPGVPAASEEAPAAPQVDEPPR